MARDDSMHRPLWEQRRRIPRSAVRTGSGFLEEEVDREKGGKGLATPAWGSDRVDRIVGRGDGMGGMAPGTQVRNSTCAT